MPELLSKSLSNAEQIDRVALRQGDQCPLATGPAAKSPAGALPLALPVLGVHGKHADREDFLDRILDLALVRTAIHHKGVGIALLDHVVGLLGYNRRDDDVARVFHQTSPSLTKSDFDTSYA